MLLLSENTVRTTVFPQYYLDMQHLVKSNHWFQIEYLNSDIKTSTKTVAMIGKLAEYDEAHLAALATIPLADNIFDHRLCRRASVNTCPNLLGTRSKVSLTLARSWYEFTYGNFSRHKVFFPADALNGTLGLLYLVTRPDSMRILHCVPFRCTTHNLQ